MHHRGRILGTALPLLAVGTIALSVWLGASQDPAPVHHRGPVQTVTPNESSAEQTLDCEQEQTVEAFDACRTP